MVSAEDKKVSVYTPVPGPAQETAMVPDEKVIASSSKKEHGVAGHSNGKSPASGSEPESESDEGDENNSDSSDAEPDEDGNEDDGTPALDQEDEPEVAYTLIAEFVGHESRYVSPLASTPNHSPNPNAHPYRVKALDTLQITLPDSTTTTYLTTISSDGKIHVYDCADIEIPATELASVEPKTIEPVARYDTKGSRLVCVAFADGEAPVPVDVDGGVGAKRKRENTNGKVEEGRGSGESDDHQVEEEEEAEEGEEEEDGNWGGVE